MLRSKAALFAVAAFLASAPAGSRGQNLEISPVLVDVSAAKPSMVVTIRNTGAGPMRYQVKAHRWSEDRQGKPTLVPAGDLAVFPELFQLAAGASRKVRVGATVPPERIERSWRLVVEELPDAVAQAGQTVVVRTRFAIPVFQAPVRIETGCDLALERDTRGLALVVKNRGTTRAKPISTTVELWDGAGKKLKALDVTPWYVLAGAERAWEVKVPDDLCAAVRSSKVVVDIAGKRLEASQPFPDGVCARP